MSSLKDKLVNEIDQAEWPIILPHHKREAVFFLKKENDLAQVGAMVAENKVHLIKGLMDANELYRPTEDDIHIWEKDPTKKFKFLIISPYVFIQEI